MQGNTVAPSSADVTASGVAQVEFPEQSPAEANAQRFRWHGEMVFYMAAIGSSIGIGNVWKFPALTWKHGGPAFVIGYLIVMIVVGVPMLVLEITLGQKTQKGS